MIQKKSRTAQRRQLSKSNFYEVVGQLTAKIRQTAEKKGMGGCVSPHEILGIVEEEYEEFKAEVMNNDPDRAQEELLDIAVACIWGLASYNAKTVERKFNERALH
jgi:type VI protein secretion system component VasK